MRILSLMIIVAAFAGMQKVKSPHGDNFRISCSVCHTEQGWKLDMKVDKFNHDTTGLPLTGQHAAINCRSCHKSLVFSDARPACISCHSDIHQASVGSECSRCHTPESWLIGNIEDIHNQTRFPLLGMHRITDCADCHKADNPLRFEIMGTECIDCHRKDFVATTEPNHLQSGFGEDCTGCHNLNALHWQGAGFNHSFFPLSLGHSSLTCNNCHQGANYAAASPECSSCHTDEYNNTTNPAHRTLGFPTECNLCHTTNPGWKPADYREHDNISFPIYSGEHRGEWSACTDCHTQPANYSVFSCINCHEHTRANTDKEHDDVQGYIYNATSCYNCHRDGTADDKK